MKVFIPNPRLGVILSVEKFRSSSLPAALGSGQPWSMIMTTPSLVALSRQDSTFKISSWQYEVN